MNIEEMLVTILQKINSMDSRLENMEARMENMETRMEAMEARMESMEARMENMETRMESMETRMENMETRVQALEKLPQQVKIIRLTLENETNRKISIIAEGHLDLNRKLDAALNFEREKEKILLRLAAVEGEVQRIKNKIDHSA